MKLGKLILGIVIVSLIVSIAIPMATAKKPPKPPPDDPPADPAIAFYLSGRKVDKLMVMNDDGSNQATICEEDIHPWGGYSWSPDGGAIAWAGYVGGYEFGVWRIDVDVVNGVPQGSNLQQLVDHSTSGDYAWSAAWSPLGDEIVYSVGDDTSNHWWIKSVPADGGTVETIYAGNEVIINLNSLTWSSDGTRIAYTAYEMSTSEQFIGIIERATGTVTHTLLKGMFNYVTVEWARGLDTLLMSAEVPAPTRIYTVDIDDPTPVEIVEGTLPCWSSDNTKFVYMMPERKPAIGVFDMTTGESEKLVNGGSRPDWRR